MDFPAMQDCIFEFSDDPEGAGLPRCYRQPLWEALLSALPWLIDETHLAVHPLKLIETVGLGPDTPSVYRLGHRGRLILRLPEVRLGEAQTLSGQVLTLGAARVQVGSASLRPLSPAQTLSAAGVAMGALGEDERWFSDAVSAERESLGIQGQVIIGRQKALDADISRFGYPVVIHGLSPQDSIRLQCAGLGRARHLGCGVFVPYKTIRGL